MTKLIIIDDHPIVREGLKAFLDLSDDLEVIAEASTSKEAHKLLKTLSFDMVLLDIQLEGENGLELIPFIKQHQPEAKVLILTSFLDEDYVREAMRLGVQGFLAKHSGPSYLRDAIYASLRGELVLDPKALKVLTEQPLDLLNDLSKREKEVMQEVTKGLTNKAIAKELGISEKTVKAHLTSIFSKLGLKDRLQLALYAKDRHF